MRFNLVIATLCYELLNMLCTACFVHAVCSQSAGGASEYTSIEVSPGKVQYGMMTPDFLLILCPASNLRGFVLSRR